MLEICSTVYLTLQKIYLHLFSDIKTLTWKTLSEVLVNIAFITSLCLCVLYNIHTPKTIPRAAMNKSFVKQSPVYLFLAVIQ